MLLPRISLQVIIHEVSTYTYVNQCKVCAPAQKDPINSIWRVFSLMVGSDDPVLDEFAVFHIMDCFRRNSDVKQFLTDECRTLAKGLNIYKLLLSRLRRNPSQSSISKKITLKPRFIVKNWNWPSTTRASQKYYLCVEL